MPPRVRVVRRDAHQPMHAALALQPAIGVLALDQHRRRLDARGLAAVLVDLLDLPALGVGIAHIHAPQHRGPVLALRAAGAGVDLDIAVVARRPRPRAAPSAPHPSPSPARPHAGLHFRERRLVAFGLRHLPQLDGVAPPRARACGCRSSPISMRVRSRISGCAFCGSFQKSGRSESAFSSARRFSGETPVKDASAAGSPTAGSSRSCFRLQASWLALCPRFGNEASRRCRRRKSNPRPAGGSPGWTRRRIRIDRLAVRIGLRRHLPIARGRRRSRRPPRSC